MRPTALTNRLKRLQKKVGVAADIQPIHGYRHLMISQLIANGTDIVTVADRAGHTNPSFTLSVYGHLIEGKDVAAANELGGQFGAMAAKVSA